MFFYLFFVFNNLNYNVLILIYMLDVKKNKFYLNFSFIHLDFCSIFELLLTNN